MSTAPDAMPPIPHTAADLTVRKAFDAIEQVERMNLQAKQYRAIVAR